MENTKENLDVQKFTVDEVMAAWMCLEDENAKKILGTCTQPYYLVNLFNDKEFMDKAIGSCERQIDFYETAIRGIRLMADTLQVPVDF